MDLFAQGEPDFSEFEKLSPYQKKCLETTNFWRIATGKAAIAIPKEEQGTYKPLSKEKEAQAREIFRIKKTTK